MAVRIHSDNVYVITEVDFIYFPVRRIPGESKLKLKNIERQLYRIRDKEYPERPKTHANVQAMFENPEIMDEYGQTMNKHSRFYAGSVVKSLFAFHIWASFATINFIKNHITPDKRNYLLDGTFKIIPSTPKLFSQLLIISIEYKNDVSKSFTEKYSVCSVRQNGWKRLTKILNYLHFSLAIPDILYLNVESNN